MKKLFPLIIALAGMSMMVSCSKDGGASFDETFLYGKWQSSTLFYKYASDHTGVTWDEADDVTEAEGKQFTWSLENAEFTHIYVTEVRADGTRASVPKVYTVTTLTDTDLVYEDDFGKVFSFKKVK